MTRRLLVVALVVAAAAGAIVAGQTAGATFDEDPGDAQTYTVVLDNAFGLTEGSDLRSSGVPVGAVKRLDVQYPDPASRSPARALATIEVTRDDFAGFRKDVFCEVKPQSLIGEYYLDCDPGKAAQPAPRTIGVKQTAATIPPDLVLSILRKPARERFGLILSELGMGLSARGDDLQATIRRGVPALRDTDRVLDILAANRQTLRRLTRDADRVLAGLASNRDDVARFVAEAGDTTAASAERNVELAASVRKLPGFLRELQPTLRDLGTAATKQTPALADLRAAAPRLTTLLRRLGPFADAARPAVRGLGEASTTGSAAIREARSTVAKLRDLGTVSTEPMRNLRFVLEDVDDRDRAVEPNRLSPGGGAGFTGLEALLQYFFAQSQNANIYDSKSYILKLGVLVNECTQYANAETVRAHPERTKHCNQWLGPSRPGIDGGAVARSGDDATTAGPSTNPDSEAPPLAPPQAAPANPAQPAPQGAPAPTPPPPPGPLPDVGGVLDDILPDVSDALPDLTPGKRAASEDSERTLLDYLLGP